MSDDELIQKELFKNIPDVSFIDGISIDGLLRQAVNDYQDKYSELTGTRKILYPANPMRIAIQTYVLKLYQLYQYVDRAGKQDLLKYSYSGFLDHIAAWRSVFRNPAKPALSTVRFTLSAVRADTAVIPKGIRVTAGDRVYFETVEYGEIPTGELYVDIPVQCLTLGEAGNIYGAGMLNVLVDPLPYMLTVSNITDCSGGVDVESDESLANRVYLAPSGYSVAGPDDAYVYWVKTYSQAITDVKVTTPEPGVVDIRVLLNNGEIPDSAFLSDLEVYLSDSTIRPLTDRVIVSAPDIVKYDVDAVYYVNKNNRNMIGSVQSRVAAAVKAYTGWQRAVIGRDINPSELTRLVMEAGAKRLEIALPGFAKIEATAVACEGAVNVLYRGLEDD